MIGDIRETEECQLKDPMDLFHSGQVVKICAPMVRYSKLAFRTLVRKYSCDLCYTPMIVAADFVRSAKARDSEFTTNKGRRDDDFPVDGSGCFSVRRNRSNSRALPAVHFSAEMAEDFYVSSVEQSGSILEQDVPYDNSSVDRLVSW
uniref:Dihydrouridine synthase 4 like n=1 Tax=Ficedula albicollis TaxID=59894 RepID=A0A803VA94_FICAL